MRWNFFNKTLLSRDGRYKRIVFACQGIFYTENQGLAMRLGKGGRAVSVI